MSNEKIQKLLARLQDEIQKTELDDDTRLMVKDLDSDIHELLGATDETDSGSVLEKANLLEANFATEHPTAERIVREVIDTLVRMGI